VAHLVKGSEHDSPKILAQQEVLHDVVISQGILPQSSPYPTVFMPASTENIHSSRNIFDLGNESER